MSLLKKLKNFLFEDLNLVFIATYPEESEKAQKIFSIYEKENIKKESVLYNITKHGANIKIDYNKPNRFLILSLVENSQTNKLKEHLAMEGVAGIQEHNQIYIRPYSLRRKLSDYLSRK